MQPLLAVVYDHGTASIHEVIAACQELCDVVFVYDSSWPHAHRLAPVLRSIGTTLDLAGLELSESAKALAALRPAGITTFCERHLGLTAELAQSIGLPYQSPETIAAITDKWSQRRVLQDAGVQATRIQAICSPDELFRAVKDVGTPAVLKPRVGVSSRDTVLVESLDDLQSAEQLMSSTESSATAGSLWVVEEYLGALADSSDSWGDYVSVESAVCKGQIQHVGITGKFPLAPPFRETGMVFPAAAQNCNRAALYGLAESAIKSLGISTGLTHTELKTSGARPSIIEVNARMGGYVPDVIRRSCGFDLVRMACELALGLNPMPATLRPTQIAFQYLLQPPMSAIRLAGFEGIEGARSVRGISRIDVQARSGDEVSWRRGTSSHIAVISGEVRRHEDVWPVLGRSLDALSLSFEFTDKAT
jgi:biotin carboxylase